jgi:hypothetical protein
LIFKISELHSHIFPGLQKLQNDISGLPDLIAMIYEAKGRQKRAKATTYVGLEPTTSPLQTSNRRASVGQQLMQEEKLKVKLTNALPLRQQAWVT